SIRTGISGSRSLQRLLKASSFFTASETWRYNTLYFMDKNDGTHLATHFRSAWRFPGNPTTVRNKVWTMLKLMKGIVAAATFGFAATAWAFPVDLESVSGTWNSPSNGSNVTGVGTDTLRWGTGEVTCTGHLWWKTCNEGPQSGYGFQGPASLPQTI